MIDVGLCFCSGSLGLLFVVADQALQLAVALEFTAGSDWLGLMFLAAIKALQPNHFSYHVWKSYPTSFPCFWSL